MKKLDQYLAKEFIPPFLTGIGGFLLVMTVDLLFTFVDLIINKGIPFTSIMALLLYKIPSIMVLTFPVATLFGAAISLGRLGSDNEIVALRTSGISFARIALPIIVMAAIISSISFCINEYVAPAANNKSQQIIREIILKEPLPEFKENLFFKDSHNRYFYIKKINYKEKSMEDIMVYEVNGEKYPRVIKAPRATLDGMKSTLFDGKITSFDNNGGLAFEVSFESIAMDLREDQIGQNNYKTTDDMDSTELMAKIKSVEKSGIKTDSMMTDYLMKFSIPLIPFIFAIIGIPLAITRVRTTHSWGLIITIVIMFTFYVFASVFRSLGRGGIVSPIFAAWTPHLIFGILGLILLYKEVRQK